MPNHRHALCSNRSGRQPLAPRAIGAESVTVVRHTLCSCCRGLLSISENRHDGTSAKERLRQLVLRAIEVDKAEKAVEEPAGLHARPRARIMKPAGQRSSDPQADRTAC